MKKQRKLIVLLSIIGMISAFLPWIIIGETTMSSFSGDGTYGLMVLLLFFITLILAVIRYKHVLEGVMLYISILPSIIALGVGIEFMTKVSGSGFVGYGIYILLITSLLVPLVGFVLKGK